MTYKEPTTVKVARLGMTIFWVSLVLSLLYVGAWFFTSMTLRNGVKDWFSARQAEGYIARFDEKRARISGFPFHVKATITKVTFAPPSDKGKDRAWVWQADKVDFAITPLPWTVRTLDIDLSHQQDLKIQNESFKGRAKEFNLSFDWMSKGLPDDINLIINDLNLTAENQDDGFKIDQLDLTTQRLSNGDYEYDLDLVRATLPVGIIGLGRRLDDVIFRGRFDQNFAAQKISTDELTRWRDAGGTLDVSRVHISYGDLLLQGNGTMALDGDLQPVGAFSARIQGFFETLERLRRAGVVRGPDATMAKVVLGMLTKHPKNGGPASISLPISLQERGLFAGPVRLIDLPKINW